MSTIENNKDRAGTLLQSGDRVRNVWRTVSDSRGYERPDPAYFGTVLECEEGRNGGIIVQVDGRPFISRFCHTDLLKMQ